MNGLIVDSFAGGGGASLGITRALDRGPDVAINHDAAAITMHAANHPATKHYTEDVWKVSPLQVTGGRPVDLLWASPDCKHFSRAKGAKPVEKKIRSLAWVVVKWAAESKPKVIMLENVREFEDWGPVVPRWECGTYIEGTEWGEKEFEGGCGWRGTEGQAKLVRRRRACPRCESRGLREALGKDGKPVMVPDPDRMGLTFRRFVGRLRGLGYKVEWKVLNAADYGAPTHRRRLFLVARRDGHPIVWPAPTHGDPKKMTLTKHLKPWHTAAECIDWSIPCPSIFDRKRPLAEATMRRIAMGIKRYVLDNPQPFIVGVGGRMGQSPAAPVDQPNNTVTAKNDRAVVTPYVVPLTHQGERKGVSPEEPLPTITAAHRGEQAVVTPFLAKIGQTGGNGSYVTPVEAPLGTQVSKNEHLLISPVLAGIGGPEYSGKPTPVDKPLGTQTTENHKAVIAPVLVGFRDKESPRVLDVNAPHGTITAGGRQSALIAASLIQTGYGERDGQAPRVLDLEKPMGTLMAGGAKQAAVAAFLAKHFTGAVGQPAGEPIGTVTTKDHHSLVTANMVHMNHGGKQDSSCDEPMRTVMAGGGHAALVYTFLTHYFGNSVGQSLKAPLGTAISKDHFGLVTVEIRGELYVIADIGMRMLTPRELARGQGFPDTYVLTGTQSSQVARIGNSVCPPMAAALVRANFVAEQVKAAA
jgi:DNA (cytosine-5)-methyltransferase 1